MRRGQIFLLLWHGKGSQLGRPVGSSDRCEIDSLALEQLLQRQILCSDSGVDST